MTEALSASSTFQALEARVAILETGSFANPLLAPSVVTANLTADNPDDAAGGIRLLQSSSPGYTGIVEFLKSDGSRNGYVGYNSNSGAVEYGSDVNAGHRFTGGTINIITTSTYANNAAAITGGLAVGAVYKTATGQLMIVY